VNSWHAGLSRRDSRERRVFFRHTFRRLLEPMIAAAGFDITDVSYQGRLYGTYTCANA